MGYNNLRSPLSVAVISLTCLIALFSTVRWLSTSSVPKGTPKNGPGDTPRAHPAAPIETLSPSSGEAAGSGVVASAAPSRLREFGQALIKLRRGLGQPVPSDEAAEELNTLADELAKVRHLRHRIPQEYVEHLRVFVETALDGTTTTPSEAQRLALRDLLATMAQELRMVAAAPVGERLLKDLEVNASTLPRLRALLSDAQQEAFDDMPMSLTLFQVSSQFHEIPEQGAAICLAGVWQQSLLLESAQMEVANTVAANFVRNIGRMETLTGLTAEAILKQPESQEAYRYRSLSAQEYLKSLVILEKALTPSQRDLLRDCSANEVFIVGRTPGKSD